MTTREEKKMLLDIVVCINSIDERLENRRILEEYLPSKTMRRDV
jgi:hypothetical protein